MPLILKNRDKTATERMDDPECDQEELDNTYRQFGTINAAVSRWRWIYRHYILPHATSENRPVSVLDIGFGGGDIPRKLAEWADADGLDLIVTGIDTDQRALDFVGDAEFPASVSFRKASSADLTGEGKTYDFVVSNHLVHHLREEIFSDVLNEARQLSNHSVLFNDIERSDAGYLLFNIFSRPVFRSSFITQDGLTSIKRSYTCSELRKKVPAGWKVTRLFPWRLLLSYHHE